jgi:hypothetical protein
VVWIGTNPSILSGPTRVGADEDVDDRQAAHRRVVPQMYRNVGHDLREPISLGLLVAQILESADQVRVPEHDWWNTQISVACFAIQLGAEAPPCHQCRDHVASDHAVVLAFTSEHLG